MPSLIVVAMIVTLFFGAATGGGTRGGRSWFRHDRPHSGRGGCLGGVARPDGEVKVVFFLSKNLVTSHLIVLYRWGRSCVFLSLFLWGGFLGFSGGLFGSHYSTMQLEAAGRRRCFACHEVGVSFAWLQSEAKQVGVSRSIVVVVLVGF